MALSGLLSVVAAQAFTGHPQPTVTVTDTAPASTSRVPVPGPEDVPPIAGDPAPLQPPAQPPAAPIPAGAPEAPPVSGGEVRPGPASPPGDAAGRTRHSNADPGR